MRDCKSQLQIGGNPSSAEKGMVVSGSFGTWWDPDAPSLFQIANVDSGEIRWIHGEEVTEIVCEYRTTIKKPSTFYEQIQQLQQQQQQ